MKHFINNYYNRDKTAAAISQGDHRNWVGGLWEEMGQLQFEFLRQHGLKPDMYVLDVGCGCLRGGIHLIDYLASGHYYGIDISLDLLEVGYNKELAQINLQHKLPRSNLLCDSEFLVNKFGVTFDIAVAQSLFTHLPLNHIKLCLTRLADVMRTGSVFYATFFLCDEEEKWVKPLSRTGGVTTYPVDDPYHYCLADLIHCAKNLPWRFDLIGDWGHPRGQFMAAFTRLDG